MLIYIYITHKKHGINIVETNKQNREKAKGNLQRMGIFKLL